MTMRAASPMRQSAQMGMPVGGASRITVVVVVKVGGDVGGVGDGAGEVGEDAVSVVKAPTALQAL
jgi:hypothetical protein